MSDAQLGSHPALRLILMSEEAIYGLILVSGMIVVSGSLVGTSINALVTVIVTVIVFFAAHVYAGTLSRMAVGAGRAHFRQSLRAALWHSSGMLVVSVPPIVILALGVTEVFDDQTAIWTALIVDTVALGVLGWLAASRWLDGFWPRLLSALVTAAFGGIIVFLKAVIHH